MGMLTETLVTALPAGITAGEAGEVGCTGPDMTEDAGKALGLSLVTPLHSVNMHSSVREVSAAQAGSGGTPVYPSNVMLSAVWGRQIVRRKFY